MHSKLSRRWLKMKRHWRSVTVSPRALRDAERAQQTAALLVFAAANRGQLCRGSLCRGTGCHTVERIAA